MSIQAMTWALEQRLVRDPTARHVLLCLANYADRDGDSAFPSALTLSEDTGLSERTVRYKLDELEQLGAITRGDQAAVAVKVKRADKRPICYKINMERGAPAAPRQPERGANDGTNGVQMTAERGAPAAPNPLKDEPSVDPSVPGAGAPAQKKVNGVETWDAYSKAYKARYNVDPTRNASVNAQIAAFVRRVPAEEAPAIAEFYVRSNTPYYVQRGHAVGAMLADAEKLRTEFLKLRGIAQTDYRKGMTADGRIA